MFELIKKFFTDEDNQKNFKNYLLSTLKTDDGFKIRGLINAGLIGLGVILIIITGGMALSTGIPELLICLGLVGFALEGAKKTLDYKASHGEVTKEADKSALQKALEEAIPKLKSPAFQNFGIGLLQDGVLLLAGVIILAAASGVIFGFFIPMVLIIGGGAGLAFTAATLVGRADQGKTLFPSPEDHKLERQEAAKSRDVPSECITNLSYFEPVIVAKSK